MAFTFDFFVSSKDLTSCELSVCCASASTRIVPLKMHSADPPTRFLCCCLLLQEGTEWWIRECRSSCCLVSASITPVSSPNDFSPPKATAAFSRAAREPLCTDRRLYDAPSATSAITDCTHRAPPAFCWITSWCTSAPSPATTRQRPLDNASSDSDRLRCVSKTLSFEPGPTSSTTLGAVARAPVVAKTMSMRVSGASSCKATQAASLKTA
mmetsp:Transcript_60309/g.83812  ORF Transcript_60309/g.83812 Transcript_60309/m.83812 type:complete len:211 (+) Transcript_60309:275-907(+)